MELSWGYLSRYSLSAWEFAGSCTAAEEVNWIAAALLATIQSLVMASAFACLSASEMP